MLEEVKYTNPYTTYLSSATDISALLKQIEKLITVSPDLTVLIRKNKTITITSLRTQNEMNELFKLDELIPLSTFDVSIDQEVEKDNPEQEMHREYILAKNITEITIRLYETNNQRYPIAIEFNKANTPCGFGYFALL